MLNGFLGPNSPATSTTMRVIMGLEAPMAGVALAAAAVVLARRDA